MTVSKQVDSASTVMAAVWRPYLVGITVLLAALILLYWNTAAGMVKIWSRSGTFTHAFLVVPISLWLIWQKQDFVLRTKPQPNYRLLVIIAGLGAGWLLGELAAVNSVTQLCFTALIVATVVGFIGVSAAKEIAFPLAFLFFAVPIGEFVMPKLMEWTANITVIGVRLSGVPVFQEGLQFVIPSGHWSVVEACSGIRYLIASITVGVLFAYMNYQSMKRRLIFVLVSIVVPLFANWARAYGIVMLGHLSGNKLATGVDHLVYGWVFFGVVIGIMFVIGMRWQEPEAKPTRPYPQVTDAISDKQSLFKPVAAYLLAIALPLLALWVIDRNNTAAPVKLDVAQLAKAGWQTASSANDYVDWQPQINSPSAQVQQVFANGKQKVGVYIAYYRQQSYERKLVSSDNVLVKSEESAWSQVERGSKAVKLGQQELEVRTGLLRQGAVSSTEPKRIATWQWYWLNGYETASDAKGKLYSAIAKLKGQGDDGAMVILYSLENSASEGDDAIKQFALDNGDAIRSMLAQARAIR